METRTDLKGLGLGFLGLSARKARGQHAPSHLVLSGRYRCPEALAPGEVMICTGAFPLRLFSGGWPGAVQGPKRDTWWSPSLCCAPAGPGVPVSWAILVTRFCPVVFYR